MKICCIQNELLPAAWLKQTCALSEPSSVDFFDRFAASWIERPVAEHDAAYKQLIPYIVVQDAQERFLCYTRHGSETRLHGLYSCGIGGHIDQADTQSTLSATIRTGMFREISEELADFALENGDANVAKIEKVLHITHKGIIYDADTEVGRVHLAVVFLAK
ncbi:MAG: hypothetical protein Ta2A_01110 [Treponemataceae bacterium]|nr:MAG: hypothetical protein Ta2A_01110 [Treponemataceae bacterium]